MVKHGMWIKHWCARVFPRGSDSRRFYHAPGGVTDRDKPVRCIHPLPAAASVQADGIVTPSCYSWSRSHK
jgi:hypothetical protein